MFDATRRRFLSLVGVGTVSGPLALKAVADAQVMALTGTVVGSKGIHNIAQGGAPPLGAQVGGEAFVPYEKRMIGASEHIATFGLPEFMEREIREESRWVDRLDPDIACKASWSMAVKFATQRQRNYENGVARFKRVAAAQRTRGALKTLLGFEWPW